MSNAQHRTARSLLIIFVSSVLSLAAAAQSAIVGVWEGNIQATGATVRLVLHIRAASDGTLAGTLDDLDQDSANTVLGSVTFSAGLLKFSVPAANATFDGKLSRDGSKITGKWTETKTRSLTFKRVTDPAKIPALVDIGGTWQGVLTANGSQTPVVLHVDTKHYTKVSASLDGLAAGIGKPLIARTTFADNVLTLSLPQISASYHGKVSQDGTQIDGIWTQDQSQSLRFLRSSP